MTQPGAPSGTEPPADAATGSSAGVEEEHFKPVGTMFLLAVFVLTIVLLWASVYVILISRGVTT